MWKWSISGDAKNFGILIWTGINSGPSTETRIRLQKSVEDARWETIYFCLRMRTIQGSLWYSGVVRNFPMRDELVCLNPHQGELEILNFWHLRLQAVSKLPFLNSHLFIDWLLVTNKWNENFKIFRRLPIEGVKTSISSTLNSANKPRRFIFCEKCEIWNRFLVYVFPSFANNEYIIGTVLAITLLWTTILAACAK